MDHGSPMPIKVWDLPVPAGPIGAGACCPRISPGFQGIRTPSTESRTRPRPRLKRHSGDLGGWKRCGIESLDDIGGIPGSQFRLDQGRSNSLGVQRCVMAVNSTSDAGAGSGALKAANLHRDQPPGAVDLDGSLSRQRLRENVVPSWPTLG